jgi:hypothetical protein
MTRILQVVPQAGRRLRHSRHRHNVLGSLVVLFAFGVLYLKAQPTTAGIDPVSGDSDQTLAEMEKQFHVEPVASDQSSAKDSESPAVAVNDTPTLTGKAALEESDRILASAQARLEKVATYAATFVKQERIGDALSDLQVIQLRCAHNPLKIFMRWEGGKDSGQRVVYSENENDGQMLVRKLTGLGGRLGVLSLNPSGSLAMKHARYPVTNVGLLELTKIIRRHRQADMKVESGVTAKMLERQKLDGRDCICFVIEYSRPDVAPDDKKEYRKAMVYIDAESKLPVCVRCFGWPEKIPGADPEKLDQTTLLELYAYKNIDFEAQVRAEDFSRARLQ